MAKQNQESSTPKQFERVFKSEDCTMIWKYDLNKFTNGPISVDIKYSNEYLKEISNPKKSKAEGKLGELHDAFAKLDAKKKKKKTKPQKTDKNFW